MIWPDDISIEGFIEKLQAWYEDDILTDCPIKAQYALDLIFKTLIDDKKKLPYLTVLPESEEQTNSIMLHMILNKYSREYRKKIRKAEINE